MKKQFRNISWQKLPIYAMMTAVSIFVIFSCQEEDTLVPDEKEITVVESEINRDIEAFPDRESPQQTDGLGVGDPITQPLPTGCEAGVSQTDFANTPQVVVNAPFYNNTTLNETGRRNGRCLFPVSLNQPCLFTGSITVNNNPGMTGNYRVITPSGAVRNVNNVSGSFTFVYGRPFPQLPLGVFCGLIDTYTVEAENPNLPGTYTKVYEVSFICSNCIIQPVDGQPL